MVVSFYHKPAVGCNVSLCHPFAVSGGVVGNYIIPASRDFFVYRKNQNDDFALPLQNPRLGNPHPKPAALIREQEKNTVKRKDMIFIARKYKQVHRKELTFDLKDWEKIERRAKACHTDTTKYLRTMILEKEPVFYDMKDLAPLLNGMRVISKNINQVTKKANETNNIYAEDIEKLRKDVADLCRTVSISLSTILSRKV